MESTDLRSIRAGLLVVSLLALSSGCTLLGAAAGNQIARGQERQYRYPILEAAQITKETELRVVTSDGRTVKGFYRGLGQMEAARYDSLANIQWPRECPSLGDSVRLRLPAGEASGTVAGLDPGVIQLSGSEGRRSYDLRLVSAIESRTRGILDGDTLRARVVQGSWPARSELLIGPRGGWSTTDHLTRVSLSDVDSVFVVRTPPTVLEGALLGLAIDVTVIWVIGQMWSGLSGLQ